VIVAVGSFRGWAPQALYRFGFFCVCSRLLPPPAPPLSPEQELASFQCEPSVEVRLVAAEPLVESPCALAFDDKGRLFVAENRGYPSGSADGGGRLVSWRCSKIPTAMAAWTANRHRGRNSRFRMA